MPLNIILPVLLFLIVLALAFIAAGIRAQEDKKFSLKAALHLRDREAEHRNVTMVVVAIGIGLAIMFTLAWGGVIGREEPSLAAFVPIWLVVFIPLLGRPKSKKKREPGTLILLASLIASIIVLTGIGMLLFWFAA